MTPRVRAVLVVLLALAAAAVWFSPLRAHLTRDEIRGAVEAARCTWYAPLLLVAMYAVGCVFAVPASLFVVTAGAIWGWFPGGTLAMAGGLTGAMLSFYTGRALGPSRQRRRFESIVHDTSFRSLLIVRVLPVLPFAALNYGAGILRVDAATFFLSTLLGLIPSNYVFAWSADEIFNGTLSGGAVFIRLAVVATITLAAILVPSLAARVVRRRGSHV